MGISDNLLDFYLAHAFELAFGVESRLPIEEELPTMRELKFDTDQNEDLMMCNLDTIDEIRANSQANIQRYKSPMSRYHDARVKPYSFILGDLVLRLAKVSNPDLVRGKFAPNCKGTYIVTEAFSSGSY